MKKDKEQKTMPSAWKKLLLTSQEEEMREDKEKRYRTGMS
jgi:hypothetical protein